MTNETTNPYRAVLEELAQSRGLSGAEELAERAVEVDPEYTPAEYLDPPGGGFGRALAAVLELDDEEKAQISTAWGETYLSPLRARREER